MENFHNVTSADTARTQSSVGFAMIALAGVWFFTIAVIILHFLRPDYNPMTRYVSEFAVGNFSSLMTIAFFALSLGSAALVFMLNRTITKDGRSLSGLLFLGIWSVCVFIAGIFKTDILGGPDTQEGLIHGLSSLLAFVSLIVASFLLLKFKRDERWAQYHRSSMLMAIAMLVTFLAFFGAMMSMPEIAGLTQRIFLAVVLTWLIVMAMRARSIS